MAWAGAEERWEAGDGSIARSERAKGILLPGYRWSLGSGYWVITDKPLSPGSVPEQQFSKLARRAPRQPWEVQSLGPGYPDYK